MTPCAARIADHIRRSGPIPFSSYMAMALYDREHGYYTSGPARIGRAGDFYTSVSTGPVFGELMAEWFGEAWRALGKPESFTVVEDGAADGTFARDVLRHARSADPEFFAALRYRPGEPPGGMRLRQDEALAEFLPKVCRDVAPVECGAYFSNELLDAIPFRRVRMDGGSKSWKELRVGLADDGGFREVAAEPEDGALVRRLAQIGTDFPDGYTTEVCPAVATQVRLAAAAVRRGWYLFFDYGWAAADYYAPHRTTGTLRCYRNHRAHDDPFDAPGETDITADVDFSLAAAAARAAGLEVLAFREQGRFLTDVARRRLLAMDGALPDADGLRWLRQFRSLTDPSHLGMRFRVLALGRGIGGARLPGIPDDGGGAAVASLLETPPPPRVSGE